MRFFGAKASHHGLQAHALQLRYVCLCTTREAIASRTHACMSVLFCAVFSRSVAVVFELSERRQLGAVGFWPSLKIGAPLRVQRLKFCQVPVPCLHLNSRETQGQRWGCPRGEFARFGGDTNHIDLPELCRTLFARKFLVHTSSNLFCSILMIFRDRSSSMSMRGRRPRQVVVRDRLSSAGGHRP